MIFFLFQIDIEGKGGWIIGGPKGMLAPLAPLFLRLCIEEDLIREKKIVSSKTWLIEALILEWVIFNEKETEN